MRTFLQPSREDFPRHERAGQFIGESQPSSAKLGQADARVRGEALASRADVFVTGGAALLSLRMVEDMKIVSPRSLWEMLQAGGK